MWRCPLFQWEREQLKELMDTLSIVRLARSKEDRVWWLFGKQGQYSVGSFSDAFWNLTV
jgi:hypothetical protein